MNKAAPRLSPHLTEADLDGFTILDKAWRINDSYPRLDLLRAIVRRFNKTWQMALGEASRPTVAKLDEG